MSYLVKAIKSLRPTSEFSFTDEDYSTIKWDILEGSAPSQSEIDAEIVKIKMAETTALEVNAIAKAAVLDRLGLTADEAALLLS